MGLFDKVRTFVGHHGCTVEFTSLERQAPASVRFPLNDTVFKGQFRVTAGKPCTVLAHRAELFVQKKHADGREEQVLLSEETHDEKRQVVGRGYPWPYELRAGESREDGFCAVGIDIPGALKGLGYSDAASALTRPELRFFVRLTIDVKGTPMDAEARADFTVVA